MTEPQCLQQNMDIAFDQFIERCQQFWLKNGFPRIEDDPLWPSCCQRNEPVDGWIEWQPVLRQEYVDFSATESALGIEFCDSVKRFYGRYYSDAIEARFEQLNLTLVQAWNDQDTSRLQENLIAHILMQRRLRQPETLFIAATQDDMRVISILNGTGEVLLEVLGKKNQRQILATNLVVFLEHLVPIHLGDE
ncbi:MAG: Protein Syd [Candidatus Celerinatantimonas neptuna]|nr:MAG: Protein Syd [Candidatus Celerinatantimonas neptuna]